MEYSIEKLINDKLNGREKRQVKSWNASKLGSCLTGVYLERLGVEPDTEFDERTLRVFSAGKLFEEWIISLVEELNGVRLAKQVRVEIPECDVTGYADLVVEKGDGKLVYEIKSKHSRGFWHMQKEGKPNRQHEMQLWIYLKGLGIPEGRICYVSKDDLAIMEFVILLNDESLKSEVENELDILNRAWKEKLPPAPPEDINDWRVKYCRFHKSCVNQKQYLK